jgi:purine-nucleoside phosphorylase
MFLFGGIVLARLVSIAISGATIPEMIMRELIAELVLIGLIFVGFMNANRK